MIPFLRIFLLVACTIYGYSIGFEFTGWSFFAAKTIAGTMVGFAVGSLVILLDLYFKKASVRIVLSAFLGILAGLILSRFIVWLCSYLPMEPGTLRKVAVLTALSFAYLGAALMVRGQDDFSVMIPFVNLDTKLPGRQDILLDTSVIIDGRIADICETSFMSGRIVVPRFVLKELQLIADSADDLKRNRGRRGLDVLNRIKNNPNIAVTVEERDFPEFTAVDTKLVKLAQVMTAKVFTNDFNLNKLAELQGVPVLNINELANSLKPIVMPGEVLEVRVLKEGKEPEQGVAYLDDGTMVVVDNGRRRIGQTIGVSITSVLQTSAGRMIFARVSGE